MLKAIRATHAFNLIFKHYYTHTALCICFCTKYNIYVRMSIHFIPYTYVYKDILAIVPNSIGYFEWLSVQPEQGNACVKLAFLQRTCEFRFNNCKLVIVPTPRKTPHTHSQTNKHMHIYKEQILHGSIKSRRQQIDWSIDRKFAAVVVATGFVWLECFGVTTTTYHIIHATHELKSPWFKFINNNTSIPMPY